MRQRCAELDFADPTANRPRQLVSLEYRDHRLNIVGSLVSVNWLADRIDADGRQKVRGSFVIARFADAQTSAIIPSLVRPRQNLAANSYATRLYLV